MTSHQTASNNVREGQDFWPPSSIERLKNAVEQFGSQRQVAEISGLKQSHVSLILSGKRVPSVDLFARLCDAIDVSPEYVLTGNAAKKASALDTQTEQNNTKFAVPQFDLGYSMGGGTANFSSENDGQLAAKDYFYFAKSFLREMSRGSLKDLFIARGVGDSMEPTLQDGDLVLIDRSQNSINDQDLIWAVAYGDLGMIKRVRAMPGGGYQLNSDNRAVSAIDAYDGEMTVIGRVVWIGRKM